MLEVRIGYWKSETQKDLPMPQPTTARQDQRKVIKALEKAFDDALSGDRACRVVTYKGFSTCRVCGHPNGSEELEIVRGNTKYLIPRGYIHYLQDHDVGYDLRLIRALKLNSEK